MFVYLRPIAERGVVSNTGRHRLTSLPSSVPILPRVDSTSNRDKNRTPPMGHMHGVASRQQTSRDVISLVGDCLVPRLAHPIPEPPQQSYSFATRGLVAMTRGYRMRITDNAPVKHTNRLYCCHPALLSSYVGNIFRRSSKDEIGSFRPLVHRLNHGSLGCQVWEEVGAQFERL